MDGEQLTPCVACVSFVLALRDVPLRPEVRTLVEGFSTRIGIARYGSAESARAALARAERVERLGEGREPFRCPFCGEVWPGVRADGGPRRACGDPRCSGRAGGQAVRRAPKDRPEGA